MKIKYFDNQSITVKAELPDFNEEGALVRQIIYFIPEWKAYVNIKPYDSAMNSLHGYDARFEPIAPKPVNK